METNIIQIHGINIEVRTDGLFRKAAIGRIGGWVGATDGLTTEQAIELMASIWKREQDGTDLSGKTTTIKFN